MGEDAQGGYYSQGETHAKARQWEGTEGIGETEESRVAGTRGAGKGGRRKEDRLVSRAQITKVLQDHITDSGH